MSKSSVAELPGKIFSMLEDLSPEDRKRVLAAINAFYGEEVPPPPPPPAAALSRNVAAGNGAADAASFFEHKKPSNKGEELVAAARYREISGLGELHSKDDLKNVIVAARRNFDGGNFSRDMSNAQHHSGYFMKGTPRGQYQLSYHGQQFMDALPDRSTAKGLKKSVRKSGSSRQVHS